MDSASPDSSIRYRFSILFGLLISKVRTLSCNYKDLIWDLKSYSAMSNALSISVPVEVLLPHVLPVIEKTMEEWLQTQPQPDPQYTAEQVSNILNIDVQTVHDYTRLEAAHPRRLRYVVTHDSAKGKRFPLSEIVLWQQRNGCDALKQASNLATSQRPARRRAA